MVDEVTVTPSAPVAAPAAEVVATPAVESSPVATPNTPSESIPAQTPVEASVVAPAAEPLLPATVLGAEPVKPVEKPIEAKPEIKPTEGEKIPEVKKEEASKSDEPAPLPTYEPWVLPEGITIEETKASEFNKMLAEFQTNTKSEQVLVQKFGQDLVDRHISEVKSATERMQKAYSDAWVKQTENWKQQFISDPEIGLNRQETTIAAANEFISTHGGTPEQQSAFRKLMEDTGIGNHPEMIRLLASAKNSAAFIEPKPLAGTPSASKPSKSQKFYGKKSA